MTEACTKLQMETFDHFLSFQANYYLCLYFASPLNTFANTQDS